MALVRGVLRHILGGVCGTEGVHATGPGDQEGAGLDSFWVMDHFFQIRTVGASEEPSSKAGQPWPSRQRRRPHPRILIGGGGEKKTLRLVARYADACNLFDSPELPHKLEVLLEHCEREGRDGPGILSDRTSIPGRGLGLHRSRDLGPDGWHVDRGRIAAEARPWSALEK